MLLLVYLPRGNLQATRNAGAEGSCNSISSTHIRKRQNVTRKQSAKKWNEGQSTKEQPEITA
jgi:hypothetical protein